MEDIVRDEENNVSTKSPHDELADLQKQHSLALRRIKKQKTRAQKLEQNLARAEEYQKNNEVLKKELQVLKDELMQIKASYESSKTLLQDVLLISTSKRFNSTWYTHKNSLEPGENPFYHYLCYGANEGYDPSPHFSTNFYLQTYPDVASKGINPLVHYLRHGIKEGRLPRKLSRRFLVKLYLKGILKRPYLYLKSLPKFYNYWRQHGIDNFPIDLRASASTKISKIPSVKSDVLKFIITGLPHSGTTALSDIFRSLPRLSSGFECGFLLNNEPRDFLDPSKKYHYIYYNNLKNSWLLTDEDIEYICNCNSWQEMYLRLREKSPLIKDKGSVLFDKTPHYLLHLDKVLKKIDGVKIVVIFKDARAQFYSYKRRDMAIVGFNNLKFFSNAFAEMLLRYKEKGKIYLLRYEDMCLNTEQEMKKAFDFLELTFDNKYLDFTSKYKSEYGRGIESKYVFAYKNHLTEEECNIIHARVKHPLFYYEAINYALPATDPYSEMCKVELDNPKILPQENPFSLNGWIGATSEVQEVWVKFKDEALHLEFEERPQLSRFKSTYPYVKGFRGKVSKGVIEGNEVTIHYKLNTGKFSHTFKLD